MPYDKSKDPSAEQFTINSLYAFVVRGPDGDEGIAGIMGPDGWIPLVGADMRRVDSLKEAAQMVADGTGMTMQIRRFQGFEVIGKVEPKVQHKVDSLTQSEALSVCNLYAKEDAVVNFLTTMGGQTLQEAVANLEKDRELYDWGMFTVQAIAEGIMMGKLRDSTPLDNPGHNPI